MASKELMVCLFLLNAIMLTNCQVIHDKQDKCNSNVDKDLLLKVKELQLEFSAYREQAMETERRLQDQITQLKEEVAKYRNESMDKQTALEDELKRQDTTIGFTALLTSALSNHNQKHVIYDVVETNEGSGYNTSTGLFTAPVAGTYVFIWHAMTYAHATGFKTCYLYLHKNYKLLYFTAFADSVGRNGGNDAASNSAVLTLNAGDTVGIRTAECGNLYRRPYTSFSGFKL